MAGICFYCWDKISQIANIDSFLMNIKKSSISLNLEHKSVGERLTQQIYIT